MGGLVESGKLPIGLELDGVRHTTFTLRPPTVQDNIDAVNEVGMGNPVEMSAAIFARQLVSLGTLTVVTTDQLRKMHPADFNEIERASAQLEKKLLLGGNSSSGGQPAEQHSPATASAPSTPQGSTRPT